MSEKREEIITCPKCEHTWKIVFFPSEPKDRWFKHAQMCERQCVSYGKELQQKDSELSSLKARMEVGEIGDVITTLHLGLTMEQKLKIENAIVKHLKGEKV